MHVRAAWPVKPKPNGGDEGRDMERVVAAAQRLLSDHKQGEESMHAGGWPCGVLGGCARRALESGRGEEAISVGPHQGIKHNEIRKHVQNVKSLDLRRTVPCQFNPKICQR